MKTVRIWKGRMDIFAIPILLGLIFTMADQAVGQVNHSLFAPLSKDFQTASEVTETCLMCHPETSQQVMQTTHWTWEYITQDGQQLGKNNVINNYCVAVSSNEPRCTSCHVGYGYKNAETFAQMGETAVDCLVCHDQSGTYKKFPPVPASPITKIKSSRQVPVSLTARSGRR